MDETSDNELVRLFKSGDANAFDAIVRRFQDRVFRLASVWLYDPQFAADAVQEVFLRAFKGLRRFRFGAAPFSWLYRTTRLVCHEFNRRRSAATLDTEPEDPGPAPDRQVADHATAGKVREFVAGLPERQRDVVMLRIFEDMSVADTAKVMGCRQGTVKALLHKATRRLQLEMSKTGFEA